MIYTALVLSLALVAVLLRYRRLRREYDALRQAVADSLPPYLAAIIQQKSRKGRRK